MESTPPKCFEIQLLSEQNGCSPVYYSGSTIEGSVLLELTAPLRPIQGIKVILSGRAVTSWKEQRTIGQDSYNMTFTDEKIILSKYQLEVWLRGNYTSVARAPQQLAGLPAGKHTFPFKMHLTSNLSLPSSFEHSFGHIRYKLVARICSTELQKCHYTSLKVITLCSSVDVNLPRFIQPLKRSKEMSVCCLCCARPIAMTVTTDRGAYCSGESIAITVVTENFSNRRLEYVQANLKQTIRFHGKPTYDGRAVLNLNDSTKNITKVIQTIRGAVDWHNKQMPIPITVPTITSNQVLQVSYSLDILLSIQHASNLNIEIPIVIGTIPYKGPSAGMCALTKCSGFYNI